MRTHLYDLPDPVIASIMRRAHNPYASRVSKRVRQTFGGSLQRFVVEATLATHGPQETLLRACSDARALLKIVDAMADSDEGECDELTRHRVVACAATDGSFSTLAAVLRKLAPTSWERIWWESTVEGCRDSDSIRLLVTHVEDAIASVGYAPWMDTWQPSGTTVDKAYIVSRAHDTAYEQILSIVTHMCVQGDTKRVLRELGACNVSWLPACDVVDACLVQAAGNDDIRTVKLMCRLGARTFNAALRNAVWEGNLNVVRLLLRKTRWSSEQYYECCGMKNVLRWLKA